MLLNSGAGEDSWESPGEQGDKPTSPKGNQPWIFIGRTDAEAEAPIVWPPDAKSQLIGEDPDAGKDWGQKRATEDEIVGWHHRLNGNEFEQAPGDSEGQGSLVCCSSWGCKELGMTYQLNNNNNKLLLFKWKRWEIESNKNIFLRKSGHQTKLDFVILNP